MTDKLTDSEIVKALDICSKSTNGCSHSNYSCEDCYLNGQPMCSTVLLQDALDLINRLQAESEAYKHYYNECLKDLENAHVENEKLKEEKDEYAYLYDKHINTAFSHIKSEAYKEFAERLKKKYKPYVILGSGVAETEIDNLLKELVGEDK